MWDVRELVAGGLEALANSARSVLDKAGGGAFCVYLRGEPVVDIWNGVRDPSTGAAWEPDTMAMSWSTTKGVTSTVLHMLVERGLLAYDEPIATVWPEFGANGKAAITLRHLMSMEAGLYDVRHLIEDPGDMLDHAAMVSHLESASSLHEPGEACAYHAFTYGWLAGELTRLATGKTLGTFVATELATPLGLDGCHVGLPASEIGRVAALPTLKPEARMARLGAKAIDPHRPPCRVQPSPIRRSVSPAGWSRSHLDPCVPGCGGPRHQRMLHRPVARQTLRHPRVR